MKKKLLSLFLALTLALSLAAPAWAATPEEAQDSAQLLYNLGLFQGSGTNEDGSPRFALERAPTRAEAVTILVRLLGAEEAAQAQTWTTPFTDVPDWAQSYVGYAYAKGYTTGVEPTRFGSSTPVSTAQFLTLLLRALGYEDGKDFTWSTPWTLTDQLGITDGDYTAQTATFLRADAAVVSANALYAPKRGRTRPCSRICWTPGPSRAARWSSGTMPPFSLTRTSPPSCSTLWTVAPPASPPLSWIR